jgi:hypothetical protein
VADFSAADAAFSGFRIVAARPWLVAVWAALQFGVALASTMFLVVSGGPAYARVLEVGQQPLGGGDTAAELTMLQSLAPTLAALLIGGLVYYAVLYAAMNRAVLRPNESRFAYLRLDGDELRQLALFALALAFALAVYLAVLIVGGFIVVVVSLASGSGAAVGMTLAIVIPVLILVGVFLAVRLSLASALTFSTRRINLFGSWRLTKGRFWALFGTYLVALALSFVVVALTLAIAVAAVAVLGGLGALGQVMTTNAASLTSVLTPVRLVYLLISSIGGALSAPVTMAPPAAIYRAISGQQLAQAFA